ncbi:ribokinase isoform X2 [Arctopsyche grandis]
MVARIGDDKWGNDYVENLKKFNVDTTHVHITSDRGTGIAQINVSKSGENQIVIVAGANDVLSVDDVEIAKDLICNASVLLCQLETPIVATKKAFQLCKGVRILNAAPAASHLDKELLSLTTILCVNESEASVLTGNPAVTMSDIAKAIEDLLRLGCKIVIITLGENGAAFASIDDPQPLHVMSDKVTAVDTTGAGDAFLGALAALLAVYPDTPLKNAIASACKVASVSVTKEGTQTSYPHIPCADLLSDKCVFEKIL